MSESTTNPVHERITEILAAAIRARITPSPGRFYSVRAVEDGHVVTLAVVAESVGMPQSGHLIFASKDPTTKENRVVRIFTPGMWLVVRDVTAEGPDAVAAFLASFEAQAGTA